MDGKDAQAHSITAEIADFVTGTAYDDIPADVIARGKIHILDALGLALSGVKAPASEIARRHVAAQHCTGAASVLGTAIRTAPRFAAFANGTAMHADNFDDTNPQPVAHRNGGIHATGAVLPAVLAVAEAEGRSGRDVALAFHLGVEVACKLNHAIAARHYENGFHSTATLGVFGAAAAVGRLMGLDKAAIGHAFAAAASRAAGVRANFGSMVEQLHSGQAAEAGIAAAELAGCGLEGAGGIFEARFGWFEAAGGGWEPDAIAGRLGNPWAFADPGTWIKPYPNGALTHTGMGLMFDLVRRHDIAADDIAAIAVRTNKRNRTTLAHDRPESALQAKFSMPFALALVALEGRAGLHEFTDATLARADVQAMIGRVDFTAFDEAGPDCAPDYTNVTTCLEIVLKDGTRHDGRADYPPGSPRAPMSFDDVAEKTLGCAAFGGWPEDGMRAAIDLVARLEEVAHIGELTGLLSE